MKFIFFVIAVIIQTACSSKKEKFNYETSIASKVYQAQLKYLNTTLYNYSEISQTGKDLFQKSVLLDSLVEEMKAKIRKGVEITDSQKSEFYNQFEKSFQLNQLINTDFYKEIKDLPITTVSDADYLRIYIKNNFVSILLNNKLLPYNAWSTMASASNWRIKNGDEFEVTLANTAWNTTQPHIWFLVTADTGTLTKENIIDTLYQDEAGIVHYNTRNYKKGENKLIFISEMNTPSKDKKRVSREVIFHVE